MYIDNLTKLREQNLKIASKTKELLKNAITFISADKPNMGIYGEIDELGDSIKRLKEKSDEKIIDLMENGKIKSLEIKIALKLLKDNDEFLNIAKKCLKIVKAKRKVIKKDKKYDKDTFEISKKIFAIFDRFISDYLENTDEKLNCSIAKDISKESIEEELEKIGAAASLGVIEEELVNLTEYISFLVKKNGEKKKKICEEKK